MHFRLIMILIFQFFQFIIFLEPTFSQNLIPNPSFEDASVILSDSSQSWHKYFDHDTPDYFNLGNSSPHNNFFDTYMGGILPKDGDAFMGIFCYHVNPFRNIKNDREFIETPLTQELEKDSTYSFKISLCLDEESNRIIRNFGILFTENPGEIKNPFNVFGIKPSILFNDEWLSNATGWMTLEGAYTALGNEKYIVIGNFYPDYKTDTWIREVNNEDGKKEKWELTRKEEAAYYYLDDLSLVKKIAHKSIIGEVKDEPPADEYYIYELNRDSAIILQDVDFYFNTSEFTEGSYEELEKLFWFMKNTPKIRIKINGYADNIGSRLYNQRLSYRRSEAVKEYLVKNGISASRIECEGFVNDKPLNRKVNEENSQLKRTVEFVILDSP